jgi:hypothetical protein
MVKNHGQKHDISLASRCQSRRCHLRFCLILSSLWKHQDCRAFHEPWCERFMWFHLNYLLLLMLCPRFQPEDSEGRGICKCKELRDARKLQQRLVSKHCFDLCGWVMTSFNLFIVPLDAYLKLRRLGADCSVSFRGNLSQTTVKLPKFCMNKLKRRWAALNMNSIIVNMIVRCWMKYQSAQWSFN